MATAVKPFDFDAFDAPITEQNVAPSYSADDIAQAQEAARTEAVKDILAKEAAEQTRLLAIISDTLSAQSSTHDNTISEHINLLAGAANEIIKRFCRGVAAEKQVETAIAILSAYLSTAPEQTPAMLTLPDTAGAAIKSKLEKAIISSGASDFISIEQSSDLDPTDCRIEWRGGAISRDLSGALTQIDSIFERTRNKNAASRSRKETL